MKDLEVPDLRDNKEAMSLLRDNPNLSNAEKAQLLEEAKCLDCGVVTIDIGEYYMVHDIIWDAANPMHHGMLCIGCLENRLGRPLRRGDFTDAPCNHMPLAIPRSARLLTAMHRP